MTKPRFPTRSTIGDELLSAYLDGQVTAAERQRVEQALAADAGLRERYDALQMTVNLLQEAPPLRVPRAFVLSEAQVLAAGGKVRGAPQPGFFDRLFPRLMPLAAAASAILLIVLLSIDFLTGLGEGVAAPRLVAQKTEFAVVPVREEHASREMPAGAPAAAVIELSPEVGRTVVVDEEVARTALVEELAKRESEKTSPQAETVIRENAMMPISTPGAKNTATPRPATVIAKMSLEEASPAATPPAPVAEKMTEDKAEPRLESAGASGEIHVTESIAPTPVVSQATPRRGDGRAWLRLAEFVLALLFIIFLAGALVLRRRKHTVAP